MLSLGPWYLGRILEEKRLGNSRKIFKASLFPTCTAEEVGFQSRRKSLQLSLGLENLSALCGNKWRKEEGASGCAWWAAVVSRELRWLPAQLARLPAALVRFLAPCLSAHPSNHTDACSFPTQDSLPLALAAAEFLWPLPPLPLWLWLVLERSQECWGRVPALS